MSITQPCRVILIDDHRHMHKTVSTILSQADDIELVAQGSNGNEAIQLCEELLPDLILMDVVMPEMDGLEATCIIHDKFPTVKILVLSSFQDHESVHAMLSNGASGYVLKGSLVQDLVSAIQATYDGQTVLSSEIAAQLLAPQLEDASSRFRLTDRELEVLGLMAEGLNNKAIAHGLTISQSTVKFHIVNVLGKLGVKTRAEGLVLAAKNNLV